MSMSLSSHRKLSTHTHTHTAVPEQLHVKQQLLHQSELKQGERSQPLRTGKGGGCVRER